MLADDILNLLVDGQWHDITSLKAVLNRPEEIIYEYIQFYVRFGFIEFDSKAQKVLIGKNVKKYFES